MSMKQRFIAAALGIWMLLALSACGGTPGGEATPTPAGGMQETAPAGTPVPAENEEVMVFAASRYACPGEEDAFYCSSALGVWESLIATGPGDKPVGVLAESYESSEDARTWTFHLRQGVVFHDGEPFNADAVLFNIERMKKELTSGYVALQYDRSFPGLESIDKVDDYTLVFHFAEPVPDLEISMRGYGSPMFSPKCIAEDGTFSGPAMGTGPFKLMDIDPEQSVTVERFDEYWGEPSGTKYVQFKTIKDSNTRFTALKAEEVMGVVDLGAIEPAMAMELIKDDRFDISTYKSSMTHIIVVNREKFPFNDQRMTEAISLMIDRQLIVDSIFSGFGVPTTNVINHTSPYYIDTPIEHDQERARELAKEVLGDEQVSVKLVLRQKDLERYPQDDVAVYLKDVLQELGLDIDIQILETEMYGETIPAGDWDMTVNKRQLPGTTIEIISSFLASDGYSNAEYYHLGYASDEADALIEEVRYEMDPARRQELYTRLQTMLYDEMLVIPYMHDESLVAFNKKIGGFGLSYNGTTVPAAYWVS